MLFTALFGFLLLESVFPLRKTKQSKIKRVGINLSIAGIAILLTRTFTYPLLYRLSNWVSAERLGLVSIAGSSSIIIPLQFILLDYTLYCWHWMNHRIPFLWRFHKVHHSDLDMDVTTASRFHFGELTLGALFRAGQILLLGIEPGTWILFETLVTLSAQFHHSNLRLPEKLDVALNMLVVTPRMHGIHHSNVADETNSNYSTLLAGWDRIHRSFKCGVPQDSIVIGIPECIDPKDVTLVASVMMPFRK